MKRPPQSDLHHRLARAVAHPTRKAILQLLAEEKGLPPRSISERLGIEGPRARYHVHVLAACGAVEAVSGEGRPEPLLRLAPPPPACEQSWRDASGSLRDGISRAQLQSLIEQSGELRRGYDGRGA